MRNPLKRPSNSGKGSFCTAGICKCTAVFKLKIYKSCLVDFRYKMLFYIFKFCLILNYLNRRGVFRTQSNICDGAFCENSYRLSAVNYFHRKHHLRYSNVLWICLWMASFAEYFASLNLSSLCYSINKENS